MSTPPTPRKTRADAARNRDRLLEAARELFAEKGSQVQLPDVARAAGVGVGTVYRHFPTLAELVDAAAEQRFAQIENYARTECLTHAGAGEGLRRYLMHVGELLSADRGLSAAVEAARRSPGSEPRGMSRARLEAVVGEIIAGDREAGALRQDCTAADAYLLVGAISATIRTGSGDWRRLLDLMLDGLRPRTS
ncbi:TetR family transcriptional regulator [Nocardia sp. 852002-20019_SCH5090214]|uniref:TetR/AcrR family transcriptional regulator n=1 Tax=Nocardia TaxID=1817 RepID=UPI0007E927E7|nr:MULTISPECIES: TetR/AcrR family transcriptional regulator [Nocardia]OBA66796.1 TetR family transcriptional regulator [Nocardia sp. 852002-20019_SCH5090214]